MPSVPQGHLEVNWANLDLNSGCPWFFHSQNTTQNNQDRSVIIGRLQYIPPRPVFNFFFDEFTSNLSALGQWFNRTSPKAKVKVHHAQPFSGQSMLIIQGHKLWAIHHSNSALIFWAHSSFKGLIPWANSSCKASSSGPVHHSSPHFLGQFFTQALIL